jgi:NADH-quinone oxidoreductase subunit K
MFAIFSIAVAAAEAAVGLAIIILVHRRIRSVEVDDASHLKG